MSLLLLTLFQIYGIPIFKVKDILLVSAFVGLMKDVQNLVV